MRRLCVIGLGVVVAAMLAATVTASAWAEAATTCVKATKVKPAKPAKAHFTGGYNNKDCTEANATHEGKYEKLADFSESEEQQLKALLKYVKVEAEGVGGKPTVKLTGANLQVASGAKEGETNGAGNVIVGADESPRAQTGSNNLVLGGEQEFTSYGGIVAGFKNAITAPFAGVLGGEDNVASGDPSIVCGGYKNAASGVDASDCGGYENTASGKYSSTSGGKENLASGALTSVSGGDKNTASDEFTSVSGGVGNTASEKYASVSGGEHNTAGGEGASVSGGEYNQSNGSGTSISGGAYNIAEQGWASISGGEYNKTAGDPYGVLAWVGGGYKNLAQGELSSIFGGKELTATNEYEACGGYPTIVNCP